MSGQNLVTQNNKGLFCSFKFLKENIKSNKPEAFRRFVRLHPLPSRSVRKTKCYEIFNKPDYISPSGFVHKVRRNSAGLKGKELNKFTEKQKGFYHLSRRIPIAITKY